MGIGRRSDSARGSRARHGREQSPLSHAITMSAGNRSQKRNLHSCHGTRERDSGAVFPVFIGDGEGWAGGSRQEVGRREDFDAVFFGEVSSGGRIVVTCRGLSRRS